MAYPDYNQLSQEDKQQIWQQLKDSAGWHYLRKELERELTIIKPPVDRDSKIKWEFDSMRLQVFAEVLEAPDHHLIGLRTRKS